jgi:hypothetical protein
MRKRIVLPVVFSILVLVCITILWIIPKEFDITFPTKTIEGVVIQGSIETSCPLPPEGFQTSQLIGTWVTDFGEKTDTLILREDWQYKQIIRSDASINLYESDWMKWRVEYGESGTPYLHIEGMRLCVSYHLQDCTFVGGGDTEWWDACENKIIRMPGEGILVVIGIPERFVQPPLGIELTPLIKDPDSPGSAYQLQVGRVDLLTHLPQ